jgi:hypothetical protein
VDSRLQIFVSSLPLKTCITNFINLDVSRVTGFPEFPNREDELVWLTRRFERLHENWVNTRRTTWTCFQCGKPGHFIADCPEKTENKDGYKQRSSKDGKYRSRRNHKHNDKRQSRKKDGHGRKARAMVGPSDVDSSSAYSSSSSSSSEDQGDRHMSHPEISKF